MPRRSNELGTDNWRRLWESNKNSHRRRARAWLQRLSNSPSPSVASVIPIPAFDSFDTGAMIRNPVILSPEDQFLHWRQDMEKKQEEQARQMKELQERVEHLQRENNCLRSQVEKMRDLDERDVQDSGQAKHLVVRDKGKRPIVLDDADILADDELSTRSSLNPSSAKSNKDRSRQRHSHRPAFSNSNNGEFRQATGRGQNQPNKASGNAFTLPIGVMPPMQPVYPAFGIGHALYIPPITTIGSPNDMLFSPLGQHILGYKPPRGFVMLTFAMFDGSSDPYDHMLNYNHAMTLNVGNNHLLCKVFSASLQGLMLAWFHRLPSNSVSSFNELWIIFISQYLCSVRQIRNISYLQTTIKQEEETIRDFTRRFGQAV